MIERRRKGVDIGPGSLLPARLGVLLVRAVAGLDEGRHGFGFRMRSDIAARRAEVDQHRIAGAADDDVVGRNIAMQEVGFVNRLERVEQRRNDFDRALSAAARAPGSSATP